MDSKLSVKPEEIHYSAAECPVGGLCWEDRWRRNGLTDCEYIETYNPNYVRSSPFIILPEGKPWNFRHKHMKFKRVKMRLPTGTIFFAWERLK